MKNLNAVASLLSSAIALGGCNEMGKANQIASLADKLKVNYSPTEVTCYPSNPPSDDFKCPPGSLQEKLNYKIKNLVGTLEIEVTKHDEGLAEEGLGKRTDIKVNNDECHNSFIPIQQVPLTGQYIPASVLGISQENQDCLNKAMLIVNAGK